MHGTRNWLGRIVVLSLVGGVAQMSGCGRHEADAAAKAEAAPAAAKPGEIALEPTGQPIQYLKIAPVNLGAPAGVGLVTGRIVFDEDHTSRVASPISGRVDALLAKPGDVVKKGQPLLTLVSPEIESAIAEERAAQADVVLAARSLERARGLFEDHAVPKKDVTQAENDVAKTEAARDRAVARLAILGVKGGGHSSQFTLRAPVAGTVVDRSATPGLEVRADGGGPLVTVSNLDRVWILADVYERDLAAVRVGQKATITIAAYPGETFSASVAHVGDVVDPQSRTVKVRLDAANAEHKLKPEMFARVQLESGKAISDVSVPLSAVLTDGNKNVVMVALAGGRFEKRNVEIASQQDGLVPVLSGLLPGERIVTDGALFLKSELESR